MAVHADLHVHTQYSWDAPRGDMEATCRRAVEMGLPAVAFTEHADFVTGVHADLRPLDVAAYMDEVERCRGIFPGLRILSGVELGEPHRFPAEAAAILGSGPLDRILGSAHCFEWKGRLVDASQLKRLPVEEVTGAVRAYFQEVLALVESGQPFQVLAHLDYPKRYWPHDRVPYRDGDFEEEIRAIMRGAAARGSTLEINTTRGAAPERGLCPGPMALRWWVECGGGSVTLGSDSHAPALIGGGFELAAQMAEGCGFKPNDDPTGFWIR